jgi:hypothetical protein
VYAKNIVDARKPTTPKEVKHTIEFACMAVTPATCLQLCFCQQCIDADEDILNTCDFKVSLPQWAVICLRRNK